MDKICNSCYIWNEAGNRDRRQFDDVARIQRWKGNGPDVTLFEPSLRGLSLNTYDEIIRKFFFWKISSELECNLYTPESLYRCQPFISIYTITGHVHFHKAERHKGHLASWEMKYTRVSNIVKEIVSRTNGRLETDTFQARPVLISWQMRKIGINYSRLKTSY